MNIIKDLIFAFSGKKRIILQKIKLYEHLLDAYINKPIADGDSKDAFNKQVGKKVIFLDCLKFFKPDTIVETGTHIGETTAYMAKESNLPIHTSEIDERYYSYAKLRCQNFDNINIYNNSSDVMLEGLCSQLRDKRVFYYLDAHFFDDLPLKREIEIIHKISNSYFIMIDDFQVIDDTGYGYDNYGKNGVLNFSYIKDLVKKYDLQIFFPVMKSEDETGYKRGSIIITSLKEVSKVADIATLRKVK